MAGILGQQVLQLKIFSTILMIRVLKKNWAQVRFSSYFLKMNGRDASFSIPQQKTSTKQ